MVRYLKYDNTPQYKKEAINDDTWSKLHCCLVLRIVHIYEFLAVEFEQWLKQKPCSSSTNAENIAARNGVRDIWKLHLLRQCFTTPLANIALKMVGNDKLLVNKLN